MRVHAYRVAQDGGVNLGEIMEALENRARDERFMENSPTAICLEALRVDGDVVYADFIKRRVYGPGRYAPGEPMGGFDIDVAAGERFAEETAIVYDARLGFSAIQYNHFGPRAGSIAEYLRLADMRLMAAGNDPGRELDFAVHLQPDIYDRLRRMNLYRSIEVKISVPGVTPEDRQRGRTLSTALDAAVGGTEVLEFGVRAGPARDSSLRRDEFWGVIDEAQRLGGSISRLVATAKEDAETKVEEFDLLKHRLEVERQIDPGDDGRYPRDVRWAALRDALQIWEREGILRR